MLKQIRPRFSHRPADGSLKLQTTTMNHSRTIITLQMHKQATISDPSCYSSINHKRLLRLLLRIS